MADEEAAHSQCVSLRLDPSTLKEVEQERGDKTLSATMNIKIENAIKSLVGCAENGGKDD